MSYSCVCGVEDRTLAFNVEGHFPPSSPSTSCVTLVTLLYSFLIYKMYFVPPTQL
jgi:hypothetical protein